jgi:two-component system, NtrC family, response regulator
MPRPKVLIIEDDEATRRQLEWALKDEFDVVTAGDRVTGLRLARELAPTVTLLDLGLPPHPADPREGLRCLRELGSYGGNGKVIVCSGHGERQHAVQAVRHGAHDFFTKPIDLDLLLCLVRRACWIAELEQERPTLPAEPAEEIQEMIGASERIRWVIAAIRKVAPAEVPVLITGESGTGKELVAKAIHARSRRRDGPFVVIDCGAIPENLLESELFGHEKGAFTGAWQQKRGKLEAAQEGTVFLDEIGELPLPLQVKLLRFVQDHVLERVGGQRQIRVDARIIAATNVSLREAIAQGEFREDLYYRLGVVAVHLPPLRDRGEDILLIAQAFLRQMREQMRKRQRGFTREAVQAMLAYPWPGNVRELSNRIQRALVMAEGPCITPEDLELPLAEGDQAPPPAALKGARRRLEAALVVETLALHHGNVREAALALGITRPTLYALLRKNGLRAEALRV